MKLKKEDEDEDRTPRSELIKRIRPVSKFPKLIKALLYGRSGTGKTTLAGSVVDILTTPANKVLLLDMREEGTDSISNLKNIDRLDVRRWADIEGAYWYLKKGTHNYGAVILDTVSQMQTLAMNAAKKKAGKDLDAPMTTPVWGILSGMLNPRLLDYRDLPMHVVFIAQDRRSAGDEDDEHDDMVPDVGPAVMPSVARDLNAMVKVIGQTYIKVVNKHGEKGGIKKAHTFRMRIGPHPVYLTKIRVAKGVRVPGSMVDPSFVKISQLLYGGK